MSRADLRLIRRAVRGDWPIPADIRGRLVDDVAVVLSDKPVRRRLAAVRCFIEMEAANIREMERELNARC